MRDRKKILRNQKNFAAVYKSGKSKGSKYVVLLYKKNNLDYSRVAFLASKKVGNSVKRNRARRLMRESFRQVGLNIVPGYDVIFIARNQINDRKCEEVRRCVKGILKSSNLI